MKTNIEYWKKWSAIAKMLRRGCLGEDGLGLVA